MGRDDVLGRFERELAFLGHTDEDHAFVAVKTCSILGRHIVFALATLELHDREHMVSGKRRDVVNEPIVQRTKGGRRGEAIAEVIAQEGAQLAA